MDLQTAREFQKLYEDWKAAQPDKIGMDVTVTVLTIGNWPTYKVRLQGFRICDVSKYTRILSSAYAPHNFRRLKVTSESQRLSDAWLSLLHRVISACGNPPAPGCLRA